MQYSTVLVGVSDDDASGWAIDFAAGLAERLGSRMVLLHVIDQTRLHPVSVVMPASQVLVELRREASEVLERARVRVPKGIAVECVIRMGNPPDEIILAAHEMEAGLIFMGSHGRGRLAQFFVGSTAEAVIRGAPCPVVTLREQPMGAHWKGAEWAR